MAKKDKGSRILGGILATTTASNRVIVFQKNGVIRIKKV